MAIADELLSLAGTLARADADQATLRRAVSTAYYSLFHLLVQDAAERLWQGDSWDKGGLERSFNHGSMKAISSQFSDGMWKIRKDYSLHVPDALERVTQAFLELQEQRHTADYDNFTFWSALRTRAMIDRARKAFQDWETIRHNPLAANYLLRMLVVKPR